MYCKNCGIEISIDDNYCKNCGTKNVEAYMDEDTTIDGDKIGSNRIGIKSLTKGQPWIVDDQWEFTINSVKDTKERDEDSNENPEQVVYIDYSYKNLGYTDSSDLYFCSAQFTVMDEEGEVASEYSISDLNHFPKETPVGAKCSNAKVAYGLANKSSQITIQVATYTSGNDSQKEKVNFVLPVEK